LFTLKKHKMTYTFNQELARKFVHFLSVFIIIGFLLISHYFTKQTALLTLTAVLAIILFLEYLRIETGKKIPLLSSLWSHVMRTKEKDRFGGYVFMILGSLIVFALFETRIAVAAILMATLGDLAAALIGKRFGKHFFMKERAWEGTLAQFSIDVLIGILVFIIFSPFAIPLWQTWAIILAMSLTATIVETLIYKMDDNLIIPVFSGFVGEIALLVLSKI